MHDRRALPTRRRIGRGGALAAALLGAALLAGCTAGGGTTTHSSATATATATGTQAATPPASATATARPTPTVSTTPIAGPTRCGVAQLAGAIGERNGAPAGSGEGMNQDHVAIILTNKSTAACTLQGWPGVSLVGDGNGTQLGAAAALDRTAPHPTLTLQPGGKAQAPLDYSDASVYPPSECGQKQADGLRVYPPGSTASLFIAEKWQACTSSRHDLLTVGAFVTYP